MGSLDPQKTLDFALALSPDTRKVVVISGIGPEDALKRERAQAEFRKYESRAEFSYLTGNTVEELRSELAALDRRSVVIFLIVHARQSRKQVFRTGGSSR